LGDSDGPAKKANGSRVLVGVSPAPCRVAWLHQEDTDHAGRRAGVSAEASEGVDAVSKKNMGSGIGEFLQEQEEGVLAAAQTQAVAEVVQAMKGKEDFEESDGFASEDQPDSGGPIVGWGG
jgi:hypothetical protein